MLAAAVGGDPPAAAPTSTATTTAADDVDVGATTREGASAPAARDSGPAGAGTSAMPPGLPPNHPPAVVRGAVTEVPLVGVDAAAVTLCLDYTYGQPLSGLGPINALAVLHAAVTYGFIEATAAASAYVAASARPDCVLRLGALARSYRLPSLAAACRAMLTQVASAFPRRLLEALVRRAEARLHAEALGVAAEAAAVEAAAAAAADAEAAADAAAATAALVTKVPNGGTSSTNGEAATTGGTDATPSPPAPLEPSPPPPNAAGAAFDPPLIVAAAASGRAPRLRFPLAAYRSMRFRGRSAASLTFTATLVGVAAGGRRRVRTPARAFGGHRPWAATGKACAYKRFTSPGQAVGFRSVLPMTTLLHPAAGWYDAAADAVCVGVTLWTPRGGADDALADGGGGGGVTAPDADGSGRRDASTWCADDE
ncbi:hypothetical protein I4F81_008883 [Pyropia yezoensis]|uniref:Uncharacterized protein n=1 Tax=Pyropia yezoensis TaxID=2788 RepID=A0ACC3C8G0_PYRYE|nr:hypothetical protein I4F81_008883 [Neopyropia yezoensis]